MDRQNIQMNRQNIQTKIQRGRKKYVQPDRQTYGCTDTHTEEQTNIQNYRHTYRTTDILIELQTFIRTIDKHSYKASQKVHTNGQKLCTDGQAGIQMASQHTDRLKDKWTEIHTDEQPFIYIHRSIEEPTITNQGMKYLVKAPAVHIKVDQVRGPGRPGVNGESPSRQGTANKWIQTDICDIQMYIDIHMHSPF